MPPADWSSECSSRTGQRETSSDPPQDPLTSRPISEPAEQPTERLARRQADEPTSRRAAKPRSPTSRQADEIFQAAFTRREPGRLAGGPDGVSVVADRDEAGRRLRWGEGVVGW